MTAAVAPAAPGRTAWRAWLLGPTGSRLAVLVALYAAFAVLTPSFRGLSAPFGILVGFGFVGLVAVGVAVTMLAGELDLSAGSMVAVGAVVGAQVSGAGLLPAVAAATVLGAVIGSVQGWVIGRTGVNSLVLTIGTLIALQGLAQVLAGDRTVLVADLRVADLLSQTVAFVLRPSSLVALVACALIALSLHRTRFGRQVYAVGGGRSESTAAGIAVTPVVTAAFGVSGGLAALAGAMQALVSGSGDPVAYGGVLVQAVTAVLVGGVALAGGVGTVGGVVVGTLVIQTLTTGMTALDVAPFVTRIVTGGLLVAIVVLDARSARALVDRLHRAATPHTNHRDRSRGGRP